MRLKTFTANNMLDAMNMVKEAMGEDAVIIADHTDKDSGAVTLTAGFDPDAEELPTVNEPENIAVEAAIPIQDADNILDAVSDILEAQGCPRKLTNKLLQNLNEDSGNLQTATELMLAAHFQFSDLPITAEKPTLTFVGTPGCGKTVTIAKLATKLLLQHQPPVLISTDTEKAGGAAQLSELADILNISFICCHNQDSLHAAIAAAAGKFVLIDTPGINPNQTESINHMKTVLGDGGLNNIALVKDSCTDIDTASRLAKAFCNQLPISWLIPTKLDLSQKIGSIMHIADQNNLTLSIAGHGLDIATDLISCGACDIKDQLLKKQQHIFNTPYDNISSY